MISFTREYRNFFALSLFHVFVFVRLRMHGFESSVNNKFLKVRDVLIQMKKELGNGDMDFSIVHHHFCIMRTIFPKFERGQNAAVKL